MKSSPFTDADAPGEGTVEPDAQEDSAGGIAQLLVSQQDKRHANGLHEGCVGCQACQAVGAALLCASARATSSAIRAKKRKGKSKPDNVIVQGKSLSNIQCRLLWPVCGASIL